MAKPLNSVIIEGRITADCELWQDGGKMGCSFQIDSDGVFVTIETFGETARNLVNNLRASKVDGARIVGKLGHNMSAECCIFAEHVEVRRGAYK